MMATSTLSTKVKGSPARRSKTPIKPAAAAKSAAPRKSKVSRITPAAKSPVDVAKPVAFVEAKATKPLKGAKESELVKTKKLPKMPKALKPPEAPKAPKPEKPTKRIKTAKASKVEKPARKERLVRDSFTMPESDFKLIAAVKQRALEFHHVAKKSEILRAGLVSLQGLGEPQLKALLESLPVIKTGRPKKQG